MTGATAFALPFSNDIAPSRTCRSAAAAIRSIAARLFCSSMRITGSTSRPSEAKSLPIAVTGSDPALAARSAVAAVSRDSPSAPGSAFSMRSPIFSATGAAKAGPSFRSRTRWASARLIPPMSTPRTLVPSAMSSPATSPVT